MFYKTRTRKHNLCKYTIIVFFLYISLYIYNCYLTIDESQVQESSVEKTSFQKLKRRESNSGAVHVKEDIVTQRHMHIHYSKEDNVDQPPLVKIIEEDVAKYPPVQSKEEDNIVTQQNIGAQHSSSIGKTNMVTEHNNGTKRSSIKRQPINTSSVFLSAVLSVRIYETDKAKLTRLELKHWIDYMLYAGVERIYLYNNFVFQNESLQEWCRENYPYTVVYHDWHRFMPFTIMGTQIRAYKHALNTYKNVSTWQIAFDMDEYPFMPTDFESGFLKRFLKRKMKTHPRVSEWSIQNFLFLGKPLSSHHILKRYLRRTPKPHNKLDKPIFLTKNIQRCGLHHNNLKRGIVMDADPLEIRMNHYWGARLQNWGEDTIRILNMTIPDHSILPLVDKIEQFNTNPNK